MAVAGLEFDLPAELEAAEPPEARGLRRDDVRLLVSDPSAGSIEHARFRDLPRWLAPGDILVVNTSRTLNAALPALGEDGVESRIHLSTRLPGGFWSVELRRPDGAASLPTDRGRAGTTFRLPSGGRVALLAPYPVVDGLHARSRLWLATLELPAPLVEYLDAHGAPIRYGYVKRPWPPSAYQTVFANEPGSAEMPSAGRPFTPELVTRLVSLGVDVAPVLLHTGVASLETHEPPYEEYYRVTRTTADRINRARQSGRQVVAVGTTVVRALETVTDEHGVTSPGEGWTKLVVTPDHRIGSVTALLTGLHEPHATHLTMLERIVDLATDGPGGAAGVEACGTHLERAYAEARRLGYLWHEFGDAHLILARGSRWR